MKEYKKYFIIEASPEEVYNAMTSKLTLEIWTGEAAEMSTEPGAEFSLWEGSIIGKNIDFIEGKKIVQQWYFGEQEQDSIVTIILHPDREGTSVELRHTNIPDDYYQNIIDGWEHAYFGGLQDFFEE